MHFSVRALLRSVWRRNLIYHRSDFSSCGHDVIISPGAVLFGPENISFEDNIFVGEGCRLGGPGRLSIGRGVVFGPDVLVMTGYHQYDLPDLDSYPFDSREGASDVIIRRFAWIGAAAVILPGVCLGEACVVGAGSVVTEDVPDFAIVVGNPAHLVRYRASRPIGNSMTFVERYRHGDPNEVR